MKFGLGLQALQLQRDNPGEQAAELLGGLQGLGPQLLKLVPSSGMCFSLIPLLSCPDDLGSLLIRLPVPTASTQVSVRDTKLLTPLRAPGDENKGQC